MHFERTRSGVLKDPGYIDVTERVVEVGAAATVLAPANGGRRYLLIQNIGDGVVELRLDGSDPVGGAAFKLLPQGFLELSYRYDNLVTGAIKAVQTDGGARRVIVAEGV